MRQSGQEKSLEHWDHRTILSQFIKEGTTVQIVRGQQRRGKMDQILRWERSTETHLAESTLYARGGHRGTLQDN